jgi:zinc ribbon protein
VTRRLALLLAAALAIGPAARAQHDGVDETKVPDVPAGAGRIVGAIENPDAPARVGDVELLLYALPASGTPGLRRGRSDATGHFAFEGVSNDPSTAYLVGARYAGVPYPGDRVAFAAGETEKSVTVRIGEPTTDAAKIATVESQLQLAWAGGRIAVAELVRFENHGDGTAYVAPELRAKTPPLARATLPDGADDFQIPLGIQPEGLVRDGAELRFYGPLYPSAWPGPLARDQGLAFHYTLPSATGPLSIEKRFPSGAQRVVVVVPDSGPQVTVAGAIEEKPTAPAKPTGDDEKPSRRLVVEHVPPGGRVSIHVEVPKTRVDPDAVKLLETRIFLELDDAALQVQEDHLVEVSGDLPVVAPEGAPLLAIPVPEGATDVRFDRDAFALGLAPDDAGGALLRGPLPPGQTHVQIAYHLPAGAGGTALFAKRFGRKLPLLNVFVADTGLRLDSERLHRRRPVKTTDRTYLALEAFEVEPSETVQLTLEPLGPPAEPPRVALLGLVALGAGGIFAFLLAPLRPDASVAPLPDDRSDAERNEREAVYAALRDLEHDRETGKLADDDYAVMRRDLRARAAALLRAEPGAAPRTPEARPQPAPNFCSRCGSAVRADDRFCSHCGARLDAADAHRA